MSESESPPSPPASLGTGSRTSRVYLGEQGPLPYTAVTDWVTLSLIHI